MADIECRVEGVAGRITLNRPAAINALTPPMIQAMHDALTTWQHDDAVHLVLIDGAGDRGLCAGADIRLIRSLLLAGDRAQALAFFDAEYRLNARIAAYPKPYVAFMDGITMGGGIGVSAHGSHRVVTERSVLAMPETGIGLFPDIGATWLLGRLPDNLGLHLGLTGDRFGPADAILARFADHQVSSAALPALAAALAAGTPPGQAITAVAIPQADAPLDRARSWIAHAYAKPAMESILAALQSRPEPEAQAAAALLQTRSPTMLKVTLRAIRESAYGTLAAALAREYRIVGHVVLDTEFSEGVRAAVIDKDRKPHWHPDRLDLVDTTWVDGFFTA